MMQYVIKLLELKWEKYYYWKMHTEAIPISDMIFFSQEISYFSIFQRNFFFKFLSTKFRQDFYKLYRYKALTQDVLLSHSHDLHSVASAAELRNVIHWSHGHFSLRQEVVLLWVVKQQLFCKRAINNVRVSFFFKRDCFEILYLLLEKKF